MATPILFLVYILKGNILILRFFRINSLKTYKLKVKQVESGEANVPQQKKCFAYIIHILNIYTPKSLCEVFYKNNSTSNITIYKIKVYSL